MTHDTMIIENLILHGIEHVDIDISDLHIDNIALTRAIDSIIRDDTLTQLIDHTQLDGRRLHTYPR